MKKSVWWPALCAFVAFPSLQSQERAKPDAAAIQDFQNRVAGYMKLHEAVKKQLPRLKTTGSSGAIERHEQQFAHKIREGRLTASQGNIFAPEIAAEFRRLIGIAMKVPDTTHVQQSLK